MASQLAKTIACRQNAGLMLSFVRGNLFKNIRLDQDARILTVLFQTSRTYATKPQIKEAKHEPKDNAQSANYAAKTQQSEEKPKFADPTRAVHFLERERQEAARKQGLVYEVGDNVLPHPIWDPVDAEAVTVKHRPTKCLLDRVALRHIKVLRWCFDVFSGFSIGKRTEPKWLRRVMFLETVAGVPGMVGAMVRHLQSLRTMKRDHGWIHTLIEEAENERMHLMTALQVRKPSILFRGFVIVSQAIWLPCFSLAYMVSPRYCHRFVGYLEEEAVKTYTMCLKDIDTPGSSIAHWKTFPAPDVAKRYWHLADDATMREVILVIRMDEAHHRDVNHTFGSMPKDAFNPFGIGK